MVLGEIIREIFDEEEKRISTVYEGIMEAVASGRHVSTEMSSYLFSHRIIPKDNPGLIQSYLKILTDIGILNKIEIMGRKKFVYRHVSPLFDCYYYLKTKYGFGELEVPRGFVETVVNEKLPHHIEDFISSFLAERFGLKRVLLFDPELDIALVRFKKLAVVESCEKSGWTQNP